jgi:hypothetical protein
MSVLLKTDDNYTVFGPELSIAFVAYGHVGDNLASASDDGTVQACGLLRLHQRRPRHIFGEAALGEPHNAHKSNVN